MSKSISFLVGARYLIAAFRSNASRALTALFLLCLPLTLPAQTLTVTNALQLWLRADAGVTADASGVVSAWTDSSGKGNNAAQSDTSLAPTLVTNAVNNKPVLRFDGVDDYLDVADSDSVSISGDITSFFVVKFDDFATFRAVWAKTSVNLPGPNDWYALPSTGIPRAYRGDGTSSSLGSVDGTVRLRAATYLIVGFEMAGTTLTHYLSGQAVGSGEITATLGDSDTALKIGSRDDFVTKMKGDIAEILIYDAALSAADRDSLVSYLQTKYNIINLPPVVTLTSPADGSSVAVQGKVTLVATASDPDGTVSKVEFFGNGVLLGTATASPYQLPLTVQAGTNITFTAVATDSKDATATSAPRTITVTGGPTPSLTVKDNLQLWLEADQGVSKAPSGAVTAWADQSGKGNNAAQPDETLAPLLADSAVNGKPVLRFDGTNDYLDVVSSPSIAITGDIASFFVVKFDDFATFRAVWGKTAGNFPAPTDYYAMPGSGTPVVIRGDGTGANLGNVTGSGRIPATNYVIAGFSQTGTTMTHYLNGQPFGSGEITATLADADAALKIGTRDDFVTRMRGDIAELLVYSAGLSPTDQVSVATYLSGKYGIPIIESANQAPVVTLTAPTTGATYTTPTNVTLTATASDSDGSVVKVDFLANSSLVGTATSSPFTFNLDLAAAGNVTLAAMATDNLGARTTSAPVNITVSSAPSPLSVTNGLQLWLRADAGTTVDTNSGVTAWADSSGNFNNATQPDGSLAPQLVTGALNGKPVLRFDGLNDYLEVPTSPSIAITGDITSLFVVKFDDFATFRAVWGKTADNVPRPTDYYTLPDSGIPRVFRGGPAGIGNVDGSEPLPAATYIIAGFDMAGTLLTHYLNGQPIGSGDITAIPVDIGNPLRIGTRGDLFTKMKGDIAEILIYSVALSEADRTTVIDYLNKKYGLGGAQPAQPVLSIAKAANATFILSWPASATGFILEVTDKLFPATWTAVTEPLVVSGGTNTVTVPAGTGTKFYRLRQ